METDISKLISPETNELTINQYTFYHDNDEYLHVEDKQGTQYIFKFNHNCTITHIKTTPLKLRIEAGLEIIERGIKRPQFFDGIYISEYDFRRIYRYYGWKYDQNCLSRGKYGNWLNLIHL